MTRRLRRASSGNWAITVGVHGGQLGHGQDLPGLRLDHQGRAAGGVIFLHPPGQLFFGDVLQGAVQGEDHVVAHDLRVPGLLPEVTIWPRASIIFQHCLGLP